MDVESLVFGECRFPMNWGDKDREADEFDKNKFWRVRCWLSEDYRWMRLVMCLKSINLMKINCWRASFGKCWFPMDRDNKTVKLKILMKTMLWGVRCWLCEEFWWIELVMFLNLICCDEGEIVEKFSLGEIWSLMGKVDKMERCEANECNEEWPLNNLLVSGEIWCIVVSSVLLASLIKTDC